eukprot:scaffold111170_cov30-Tisochrysis_lutea.AAC.3
MECTLALGRSAVAARWPPLLAGVPRLAAVEWPHFVQVSSPDAHHGFLERCADEQIAGTNGKVTQLRPAHIRVLMTAHRLPAPNAQ